MRRRWRRPRRVKVQWKLIFTLILLGIMLFIMDKSLKPIMEAVSENEARVSAMQTIQETVLQELETGDITYSDLVDVQRDDAGNILAITTNIVRMNELKSSLLTKIQNNLSAYSHQVIGIPIGTLTGSEFLHGRGPEVPLRVTLAGNAAADFESQFESAGINQTKHRITLKIHLQLYTFIPGIDGTVDVDTDIPVAETVIVGEVPDIIANLSSLTGS